MKKLMMMAVILLAGVGSVMAQSDYKRGIFNHVGLNVGAGTRVLVLVWLLLLLTSLRLKLVLTSCHLSNCLVIWM